ncbi:MAG: DUF2452 domain-containing protein [Spirochaetota bacterium]
MDERPAKHNKKEPIVENKRSLAYPTRTLDPPITLVDRAREIETAQESIRSHVDSKLDLILKQIRALQEEAKDIISAAQRDVELHKVKCNFEKQVGQSIYLYEKDDGEKYFSLISPEEWNPPPHTFLATYTMRGDRSFSEVTNPDDSSDT